MLLPSSKFYSNQPWYTKLWRNKTLFFIPFEAVSFWWNEKQKSDSERTFTFNDGTKDVLNRLTFKQCLSLARGFADVRRNHLYLWNDIKRKHGWEDVEVVDGDLNDAHYDAIQDEDL